MLCDTTIVSSIFGVDGRARLIEMHRSSAVRAVSVITVGEVRFGQIRARWGQERRRALDDHLRTYVALAIDESVADVWARLRQRCLELGRAKRDNDLWIAATAKRYGLPLATLDRDHHDIPGITVIRDDGSEVTTPE
ncbi:MAG: PIN domain-containing protein [Candidatus Limnocylindria bacterium]